MQNEECKVQNECPIEPHAAFFTLHSSFKLGARRSLKPEDLARPP
jgi:hypothetical protein